jgi:release factor glutamine methyltransferase
MVLTFSYLAIDLSLSVNRPADFCFWLNALCIGECELTKSIINRELRHLLDCAERNCVHFTNKKGRFARCGKLNQSSMQAVSSKASSIRALLVDAERSLAGGPHPDRARRDAQVLLLHLLAKDAPATNLAWLLAHQDETADSCVGNELPPLVARRLAGEPIQYITGLAEFYGLSFQVNRDVLIPRPETEHLMEKAIDLAAAFAHPRIVDVGTGSGAIAVALARHLPQSEIIATDLSVPALAVARANADRHNVADRVRFFEGDLLVPVAGGTFDLVVSNPPYVSQHDRATLSVEVREYEPAQALYAGDDGLAIYRRLIPAAFAALSPGGYMVLEIGFGQSGAVGNLLRTAGFHGIEFNSDLQGIPRVASARHP